jgi:hypothetical protein
VVILRAATAQVQLKAPDCAAHVRIFKSVAAFGWCAAVAYGARSTLPGAQVLFVVCRMPDFTLLGNWNVSTLQQRHKDSIAGKAQSAGAAGAGAGSGGSGS